MDNPDQLKLGGERKELSVLFVDIRGFTTLAEGMDPVDLAGLLNAFTDAMTEVILENGGLVDKYIGGDSVMAVFGAPVDQPDHARRACRAALAMVDRVARLNRDLPQAQGPQPGRGRGRQQRAHGRGQHGLQAALRLHSHRRQREPGLAPGGPDQGIRR